VDDGCWLRCPWHGWDFDPLTGKPPGGHEDTGQETYPVEVRDDGVYVQVPAEPERARTVSDVMAETMVNWGVTSVFGMVGHSNLGLADALRVQESKGALRYYGIRHEGAAAFAASGYGKLTGRAAAAFTIAGPGATNLLTGLWDAKVDGAPALALTGQVQEQVIGVHAFQDIDLEAAFEAVSVFSETVHPGSAHAQLMSQAIKTALVERGVGHLIFPDNVQTILDDATPAQTPEGRMADNAFAPPKAAFEQAVKLLKAAKRPMMIVGYGALDGMPEIIALAEKFGMPIATTFKAKGQIADSHPLAAGVLGRSGTPIASWFMNEADLMLVFGSSFSDHTGINEGEATIQVDNNAMRLAKRHPVTLPLMGDVGVTASQLIEALDARDILQAEMKAEVADRWKIWRAEKAKRQGKDLGNGVSAAALFDALTRAAPHDAVLPVDVGNNTYSFGRYFEPTGQQRVLMSGYLGSIGFSFPAAMGAWAATQEDGLYKGRKVISVSGDGGFGQYAMEFTTAVKYGMNICHILMNNSQLGKISKEQRGGEFPVWQTDLVNPSFAGFARSCGGMGELVTTKDQLDEALAKGIAHNGPALIEVITDASLL
jgi:thiamine pyrophosphate-dependent acetolactate synthase large subunit-like protein